MVPWTAGVFTIGPSVVMVTVGMVEFWANAIPKHPIKIKLNNNTLLIFLFIYANHLQNALNASNAIHEQFKRFNISNL